MGRRRNKLRNATGLIGLSFFEANTELLKFVVVVAHIYLPVTRQSETPTYWTIRTLSLH